MRHGMAYASSLEPVVGPRLRPPMWRSEFTCPVCGSHCFNTTFPNIPGVNLSSPVELLIGQCKGHPLHDASGRPLRGNYRGCRFRWPRSDDARYGLRKQGGTARAKGWVR
jgi:hypothetical protein